MSRIHEALKKAELERAGTAPAETPAVEFHAHVIAPMSDGNGKSAVTQVLTETRRAQEPGALEWSDVVAGCSHPEWHLDPSTSVFLDPVLTVDSAEQFRSLRSRLYQMRNDQTLQTLVVTSALPGEGKTFVTSNLGQAIVRQHERRALILDGDLRRSHLHTAFRAPSRPGLSDYLRGDADLLTVIQQGLGGGLCVIPGGNPTANPTELLCNGRLKGLLEQVSGVFDWILIDSPPCLPVADANILADICDGVLFVVKARSTPSAVVEKAGRELRGRNVVGVVMNQVDQHALGYSSHYGSPYIGEPQGSKQSLASKE
jgi:capsular exopolysaccharide synthesis family protein